MSFSWVEPIAFIAAICILVAVHEFGHFWVARLLGFRVQRFSIGFGKALFARTDRKGTEFVLAMIPLGGYVKLLDEREGPVAAADLPYSFTHRPPLHRIAVLLAGPLFNIVFAILVLAGMLLASGSTDVLARVGEVSAGSLAARAGIVSGDEIVAVGTQPVASQREVWLALIDRVSQDPALTLRVRHADGTLASAVLALGAGADRRRLTEPSGMLEGLGFHFYEPPIPAVLGQVEAGGPAALAGLRSGDEIIAINDDAVSDFRALVAHIQAHPGETVLIRYRRSGTESSVRVTTLADAAGGHPIGRIRVTQPRTAQYPAWMLRHQELSVPQAFARASAEAWNITALQGKLLWRMIAGQVSVKNLSGPLSIAQYAGESAAAGPAAFLGFLVMISLALGFMNLLPIPILDGGQVVFQLVEWIRGKALSERALALSQQLGLALLVLLMGIALFNDIIRQFG